MIVRIVKMELIPGGLAEFLEHFSSVMAEIRQFPGCTGLELLSDNADGNIVFTMSTWESDEDLGNYRNSDLFRTTWGKVKPLFCSKAVAWSLEPVTKIP